MCLSCLVFVRWPHQPYAPSFPFTLFCSFSIGRSSRVLPSHSSVVAQTMSSEGCFCNCNTTSRKLGVICLVNKNFLLRGFSPHYPQHHTALFTAQSWWIPMWCCELLIRWQMKHLFSITFCESDLIWSKHLLFPSPAQLLLRFALSPPIPGFSLI